MRSKFLTIVLVAVWPFTLAAEWESPRLVGSIGGFIGKVEVQDTTAYLLQGTGLTVLDVAEPKNPRFDRSVPLGNVPSIGAQFVISESLGYLSNVLTDDGGMGTYEVQIIDLLAAGPEIFRGLYATPEVFRYLGGHLAISGTVLFLSAGTLGLHIIDVSNPDAPKLRSIFLPILA